MMDLPPATLTALCQGFSAEQLGVTNAAIAVLPHGTIQQDLVWITPLLKVRASPLPMWTEPLDLRGAHWRRLRSSGTQAKHSRPFVSPWSCWPPSPPPFAGSLSQFLHRRGINSNGVLGAPHSPCEPSPVPPCPLLRRPLQPPPNPPPRIYVYGC